MTCPAAAAPVAHKRHRRHANPFSMQFAVLPLDEGQAFAAPQPLWLDIGCGKGAFVAGMATAHPDRNVLGLELRQFLVDAGNEAIAAAGLGNARVVRANANLHLNQLLPTQMLAGVTLNFPDPWFKLRHHKRRVLTPALVAWLRARLAPGHAIHVMTDVGPLAALMRQRLTQGGFCDQTPEGAWPTLSSTGVTSERELWHQARGDRIWRCHFRAPSPTQQRLQAALTG